MDVAQKAGLERRRRWCRIDPPLSAKLPQGLTEAFVLFQTCLSIFRAVACLRDALLPRLPHNVAEWMRTRTTRKIICE